jgi:DNA-binding NarL/FixJ family response regulator
MRLPASGCPRTGLGVPECSCPECTARLVQRSAPDSIRTDPLYRVAAQPPVSTSRSSAQVIPFPRSRSRSSRRPGAQTQRIRVAIAHREELTRSALQALLTAERGITVTGLAADGDEAVALARSERPDVVILDARLSGADAVRTIRRMPAGPGRGNIAVVMLAAASDADRVIEVLRAGADAVLSKNTAADELMWALRVIVGGQALRAPGVTRLRLAELGRGSRTRISCSPAPRASGEPLSLV